MSKRRALRIRSSKQVTRPVVLYDLVFYSITIRLVVFLMLAFFALQPMSMVFASETTESASVLSEPEIEVADIEEAAPDGVEEETKTASAESEVESGSTVNETSAVVETEDSAEVETPDTNNIMVDGETISNTDELALDLEISSTTEELVPLDLDTKTTTSTEESQPIDPIAVETDEMATTTETNIENPDPVIDLPQTNDDLAEEELSDELDNSSSSQSVNLVDSHVSDANRYQFAEDECVLVADGSFYCSQSEPELKIDSSTSLEARLDEEGDLEIFLTIDNEVRQLSNNQVDDASPKYDALSESVVWHRLINGRYEIVTYDLNTEEEMVLTNNDVNDMEPDRSGEHIVWQRWQNNNWEIILYDGIDEKQITFNEKHDVAPSVRGGFIIWHTNDGYGERQVAVYEIATGLVSEISDPEGGVVENPRFVLVYDTAFPNGDVVTKGYDFGSGEVVPLSAIPGDLPQELPDPDQTGETRALIQTKSTSREDGEVVSDDLDLDPTATSTATTSVDTLETDTNTIDLSEAPTDDIVELTEFDLVIMPYDDGTSSSTQGSNSTSSVNLVE